MAVARDAHTSMTKSSNSVSSYTFSHTSTGSDLYLVVHIYEQGTGDTITGVTYNGVSMSLLSKAQRNSDNRWVYQYGLVAPATGANDVVISRSGTDLAIFGSSTSYTGVDQTTPTDGTDSDSGSGATITSTITTTIDNCALVGMGVYASGSQVASTNTAILSSNDITSALESSPIDVGTAGSVSLVVTATSANYGQVAVALSPVQSSVFVPKVMIY